jgi:hypothetical protein
VVTELVEVLVEGLIERSDVVFNRSTDICINFQEGIQTVIF